MTLALQQTDLYERLNHPENPAFIHLKQDLPEELVPLIQQQQIFVRQKFGEDFPWLFPNWTAWREGFSTKAWPPIFSPRMGS